MLIYILTALTFLAFFISFLNDRRKLINGILLLAGLGFLFLSIGIAAYESGLETVHTVFIILLFGGIPIMLVFLSIYMFINGFVIFKKEGVSLSNSLSLLFGLSIFIYFGLFFLNIWLFGKVLQRNLFYTLLFYGFIVLSFVFFILIFIFFAFLIYSVLYLNLPKRKDYDFIIVHGSGLLDGIRVSPLLASRIDKGIEAYNLGEKSDVILIASGGRGSDEKISEALAIAEYMIERGIPKERIIIEDESSTTFENLLFSKKLAEDIKKNPKFLFVTNNYHVLRTSLYAKRLKMKGEGVGSATAGYYLPSAFLREYAAILVRLKWIIISLTALLIIFIWLSL